MPAAATEYHMACRNFSTQKIMDQMDDEDHGMSLDGRQVAMGGILTEVKGKATKKGAYMGFITLEDLTGSIEGLIFPKVFERIQGTIAEDDVVVVTGKISIREEESRSFKSASARSMD